MDKEKLKKLLLVALSSDQPGEAHAALGKVKKLLTKEGLDIHWLADTLGTPVATPKAEPFSAPTYVPPWQETLMYCVDRRYALGPREEEFIGSLLMQSTRYGWEPSIKQEQWLLSIFKRLVKAGI